MVTLAPTDELIEAMSEDMKPKDSDVHIKLLLAKIAEEVTEIRKILQHIEDKGVLTISKD